MVQKESELVTLAARVRTQPRARPRLRFLPYLNWLVYLGGDLLALVLAHTMAVRLVQPFLAVPFTFLNPAQYHRYYIPFFAVLLYFVEGYKNRELRRPERELELCCKAVSVGFLGLVLFNFVVFRSQAFSRYLLVTWFVLAGVLVIIVRFTLRAVYAQLWQAGIGQRRAVLIGAPAELAGYRQLLCTQRHCGYNLLGVIPVGADQSTEPKDDLPFLGSLNHWESSVRNAGADLIVMAAPGLAGNEDKLGQILHRCKELGIDLELYSSSLAASDLNYERDEFSGCFRFYARPSWSLALQRLLKRGMDIVIGLVGSAATLLLTPFIALLIKLQDGGPIFYRSAYLGCDLQDHYYMKFRTMRVDADQILKQNAELRTQFQQRHKLLEDPRVTRLGRFLRRASLDEFPQFFSVLKGDLTFVGPRTIRQEEAVHYGFLLPKLLSVKPGVTGFWQAMGRQTTTYQERVQMDMFYMDHWSIWLDLVIIAQTFWKVLKAEGAY